MIPSMSSSFNIQSFNPTITLKNTPFETVIDGLLEYIEDTLSQQFKLLDGIRPTLPWIKGKQSVELKELFKSSERYYQSAAKTHYPAAHDKKIEFIDQAKKAGMTPDKYLGSQKEADPCFFAVWSQPLVEALYNIRWLNVCLGDFIEKSSVFTQAQNDCLRGPQSDNERRQDAVRRIGITAENVSVTLANYRIVHEVPLKNGLSEQSPSNDSIKAPMMPIMSFAGNYTIPTPALPSPPSIRHHSLVALEGGNKRGNATSGTSQTMPQDATQEIVISEAGSEEKPEPRPVPAGSPVTSRKIPILGFPSSS
jgi:hypothetical protein